MFLQANWYKAEQYCRFHGMHLARYCEGIIYIQYIENRKNNYGMHLAR